MGMLGLLPYVMVSHCPSGHAWSAPPCDDGLLSQWACSVRKGVPHARRWGGEPQKWGWRSDLSFLQVLKVKSCLPRLSCHKLYSDIMSSSSWIYLACFLKLPCFFMGPCHLAIHTQRHIHLEIMTSSAHSRAPGLCFFVDTHHLI